MTLGKVLVTGGVRSGKSRHAEALLADASHVTYIAPGRPADFAADPEWAARIATHQARRPAHWTTRETVDLATALRWDPPLLIDCLGTWLTAVIDGFGTWDQPLGQWRDRFEETLDEVLTAWEACPGPVVAVTNEVGWGLVSEHRSGRIFTDLLGQTNAAIAARCDTVRLVVAGRALEL